MSLNITATPEAFNQLSALDYGQYDTIQTIAAYTKTYANTSPPPPDYNTRTFPTLKIAPIANSTTPVDDFFKLLTTQITNQKKTSYAICNHIEKLDYVAIPNFDSRVFHVLYDSVQADASLTTTLAVSYYYYKLPSVNTPLLVGGNGPFFEQIVDPALFHIKLLGNSYKDNIKNPYNAFTGTASSSRIIQWDATKKIQFKNNLDSPPGVLNGGDGFESLPPIIWPTGSGGSAVIAPTAADSGMINSSTDTGMFAKGPHYSRHIVAYHATKKWLLIIVGLGGYFSTLDPSSMTELYNNLQKLGFTYAVFFDGASSVFLWEFSGKGTGSAIRGDDYFDAKKDKYLHLGYGIA
jgi:hypothetical protein